MKKLAISNDGPLSNVDLDDIDLISDKQAEEIEKNISGISRNFAEKFSESDQVLKIDHVQGSTSNLLKIFETKFLNESDLNLTRDAGRGVAGGVIAPSVFGRSVNSISTRGADLAHHVTTGRPRSLDSPPPLLTVNVNKSNENSTVEFPKSSTDIIQMTSTVTPKEKRKENVFNQIVNIHKEKRKENYFTVRCYVCKLDFSEYGEYKQHMFSCHQFIKTSIEQSFSNEEKLQNETGNRNFAINVNKSNEKPVEFPKTSLDAGLSSSGVPILADQLTQSQPGRADYAHHSTTGTPGFSDLPKALPDIIQMASTPKEKRKDIVFDQIVSNHKENYSIKLTEELRCPFCDKIQTNKSSLEYHISTVHYFKCSQCVNQFFLSQEELDLHFQDLHTTPQRFENVGGEDLTCPFCNVDFIEKSDLLEHISNYSKFKTGCSRVESDKKKKILKEKSEELRCPYCDIIQSNKSSLLYHITNVHYPQNLDLYENTDQSVNPKQRKTSEEGIEVVTLDEIDSPEFSNKKSNEDLSFKSEKSLVETDFSVKLLGEKSEELRCPYCDKIQTNKSSLSYHISTVHYFQNPFLNENTDPSIEKNQTENKDENNEVITSDTIDCFEKSTKESKAIETGIILLIDQVAGVIFIK